MRSRRSRSGAPRTSLCEISTNPRYSRVPRPVDRKSKLSVSLFRYSYST
ncbi:hypothetical protein ACO0KY_14095 [Undibacterium sp. Dicai25W]